MTNRNDHNCDVIDAHDDVDDGDDAEVKHTASSGISRFGVMALSANDVLLCNQQDRFTEFTSCVT